MIQLYNDAQAYTHALTNTANTVVGHQWQAINGKSLSSQTHAASSLQKPFFTAQVPKTQASQSKHQLYIWALDTLTSS